MNNNDDFIDRRRSERTETRFAARLKSGLRVAFDSAMSSDDDITSVIVSDVSNTGMATSGIDDIDIGSVVMVEVPLVGWRAAKITWIANNRAGCRFLVPLSQLELRSAVTTSSVISEAFPGLAAHMDRHDTHAVPTGGPETILEDWNLDPFSDRMPTVDLSVSVRMTRRDLLSDRFQP